MVLILGQRIYSLKKSKNGYYFLPNSEFHGYVGLLDSLDLVSLVKFIESNERVKVYSGRQNPIR